MNDIYTQYLIDFCMVFLFYTVIDILCRNKIHKWGLHSNLFTAVYMAFLIVLWERQGWKWYHGIPVVLVACFLGEIFFRKFLKPQEKGAPNGSRTDNGSQDSVGR